MAFFSNVFLLLKQRRIKRELDLIRSNFTPIFSSTQSCFENNSQFIGGVDKWDLRNPLLQQWLGYNFGLVEAGASSLFGTNHEYDISRDLALLALIQIQFEGLPHLEVFIDMETTRLQQRTEGEDNAGFAASMFEEEAFRAAYKCGVVDIREFIADRKSLQFGLVMLLSAGKPTIEPNTKEIIDHVNVSCSHAEQEFTTEAEAIAFSKWAGSTVPDSQAATHQAETGKWIVRWIEPIYLDSEVKLRDVDSLDDEFIFS